MNTLHCDTTSIARRCTLGEISDALESACTPTNSPNVSQSRLIAFDKLGTGTRTSNNQNPLFRNRSQVRTNPLLKRFKSAENGAFEGLVKTDQFSRERQKRKNEKKIMAEIDEALSLCKSVSVSLLNAKINPTLNTLSNLMNTEEDNSHPADRFSRFRQQKPVKSDLKLNKIVLEKEFDYFISEIVPQEEVRIEVDHLSDNEFVEEEKPKLNLFKHISTPSHKTNNSKDRSDGMLQKTNKKSTSSKEDQNGFKISTNEVFSFHNDFQAFNQESAKKKKKELSEVIMEQSYDDSFGTSRYEHISENSLINKQWQEKQRLQNINSYLLGESSNDLSQQQHSEFEEQDSLKYRYHQRRPSNLELSDYQDLRANQDDTLKRDSHSKQKSSHNYFEKPRKLDVKTVKGSVNDKPKRFVKPKHIAIDITQLSKAGKKKNFDNFMQKTKKSRGDIGQVNPKRKSENMFFDNLKESVPDKKDVFKKENSYKQMFNRKKSMQTENKGMNLHRRRNSTNAQPVNKEENSSIDKLLKQGMVKNEQGKTHKRIHSTFARKTSLNSLKPVDSKKNNNFMQKFRQSAKKTKQIGRCFNTQIESIKKSKEESLNIESESIEYDLYETIIDKFNNPLKATMDRKPTKGLMDGFRSRKEDSIYTKAYKTSQQSSRNSSKHNVKIDVSHLSKRMKFDLESCFKKSRPNF